LFLTETAPRRLGQLVSFLIEMLAAIPSVVYGLWGLFVLVPLVRESLEPWLATHTESIPFLSPFFSGPRYGVGMLSASLVLSVMILPTIASVCREIFRAVPDHQREAALALGATRWESIRLSVLHPSLPGIVGAVVLGLGRAIGETMAVTMVIGNRAQIVASILAPGQTMASVIANEYAEASGSLHLAALAEVGLVLFVVTFGINLLARALVWNLNRRMPK
jgi:phosphate transport system permease protein